MGMGMVQLVSPCMATEPVWYHSLQDQVCHPAKVNIPTYAYKAEGSVS